MKQFKTKKRGRRLPFFGHHPSLLDVKQVIDLEQDYKRDCMLALKSYRQWLRMREHETDIVEIFYGDIEGKIRRRYAEEWVRVRAYWAIRQDAKKITQNYFEKNIGKNGTSLNDFQDNRPVFLNVA